jgi:beta-lactam-binding protein with PASTA domain
VTGVPPTTPSGGPDSGADGYVLIDALDGDLDDDLPLGSNPLAFVLVLAGVIATAVMIGNFLLDGVSLAAVDGGPELVDVPELIGEDHETAIARLNEAELVPVVATAQNVEVPPGQVIDQRPLPGERVELDTEVEITVSIGNEFARVPDVRGSPAEELGLLLAVHGLSLGDTGYQEDDAQADEVIGQLPAPGEVVALGGAVHVMLSSGPPMVDIPDVRNLPQDEAIALLREAGFVATPETRYSTSVRRGSAMSTDPSGEAPKGSQIIVYISQGPPPTTTTTTEPEPEEPFPGHETYEPFNPSQPQRPGNRTGQQGRRRRDG